MKRLLILYIVLCIPLLGAGGERIATPKVDQRVELLSIVFRLAGNPEYNSEANAAYVKDIHQHFDRYKNHQLIKYAGKLRDNFGVGFDAVMSMVVHLEQPPLLSPLVPFSEDVPDSRWGIKESAKFIGLLQAFYKDADCASFFKAHEQYYAKAGEQFDELFKKLDADWYYSFYGKAPKESFNIVIGLCNGGGNFGPKIELTDKSTKVYAIIGCWSFDSSGKPVFESDNYLPTLIHEFNHSFINYLTDEHEQLLRRPGTLIYDKEAAKMKKQAYGSWEVMMSESLVRAAVIRYLINHSADTAVTKKEMTQQLARGFVWMRELVDMLAKYEGDRSTYPTLESFMPTLIKFYDTVATNIDAYEKRYDTHCAHVTSVQPFKNNDKAVNPGTKEIIINFDKRLDGVRYFFGPNKKGSGHYPTPEHVVFSNDNKTIILKVSLQPNTGYEVYMTGEMMRTDSGYSAENYLLQFKTGGK